MCGRFYVSEAELDDFAALVEDIGKELLKPRPNADGTVDLVPGDPAPVFVAGSLSGPSDSATGSVLPTLRDPYWRTHAGDHPVRLLYWGFPSPAGKGKVINARAETVMEKPLFRLPFAGHRCLIPARGFYEWMDAPAPEPEDAVPREPEQLSLFGPELSESVPQGVPQRDSRGVASRRSVPRIRFRFSSRDGSPLAMGGLYWTFPVPGGGTVTAFTILTVAANDDVREVHDRMPLLLPPHAFSDWLRPGVSDSVRARLLPPESGLLRVERSPGVPAGR